MSSDPVLPWMNPPRAGQLIPVLLLAALLGACASYGERMAEVEDGLRSGRTEQALTALQGGDLDDDALLGLLNRGVVHRRAGEFEASIAAFEAAKDRMAALEPISITGAAASVTVTEGAGEYAGEVHEHLLVHVMQALNFLQQDDLEAAQVEARQIDLTLRRLETGSNPRLFGADAFPRYLSGIVFEAARQYSDAMIAYRKAYQAYTKDASVAGPVPEDLQAALVRLAMRMDLIDEAAVLRRRFGDGAVAEQPRPGDGQLVFVLLAGLAPTKRERSFMAYAGPDALVRVSLPYYQPRPPGRGAVEMTAGGRSVTAERVTSVSDIAQSVLEERIPALVARAGARNLVKNVTAAQLGKESAGLGLFVRIAGLFLEGADTRSWRTLPDHFRLARMRLPAGRYDVTVRASSGAVIASYDALPVPSGGITVRSSYWLAN